MKNWLMVHIYTMELVICVKKLIEQNKRVEIGTCVNMKRARFSVKNLTVGQVKLLFVTLRKAVIQK